MNRGHHLIRTLPVNILENKSYPYLEFVVLDYNSKDNVGDWIKQNLTPHIKSGLLKYYRTNEPEFFKLSHSKNMAMRLATGDILCMVDADNFAGPGYAHWVDAIFSSLGKKTLITTLRKDRIPYQDQGGKFCVGSELFYFVKGMDEGFIGYGMEDTDLINRMENAGGTRFFLEDKKYLRFIGHSDSERLRNYGFTNSLAKMYLRTSNPSPDKTSILYMLKDNTFAIMNYRFHDTLRNNMVRTFHGWMLDENGMTHGMLSRMNDNLILDFPDRKSIVCRRLADNCYQSSDAEDNMIWKEVDAGDELYIQYILAFTECTNRRKFIDNDKQQHSVNPDGWGRGAVTRNFDPAEYVEI
jgi:hypothetical protein